MVRAVDEAVTSVGASCFYSAPEPHVSVASVRSDVAHEAAQAWAACAGKIRRELLWATQLSNVYLRLASERHRVR